MRSKWSAPVVVALVVAGFVAANVPDAGAVSAVSQNTAGEATGHTSITLGAPNSQRDQGSYTSRGQLGSGRYSFVSTVTDCNAAGDMQTLSGTATLTRYDGATLQGTLTGTEVCYGRTNVTLDLTSGTRDLVSAKLVFSGSLANLILTPNGQQGTESFSVNGSLVTTERIGWWMLGISGNVYAFGGAPHLGNAPTQHSVAARIEPTPSGNGYWIVNDTGQVYARGDARWFGNADRRTWANPIGVITERVVSIASTASGNGYWLFTTKGRVVPFGDAVRFGDVYPQSLTGPIVAALTTPSRNGYYLVGSDGGVFAYGDATFHGSTGDRRLNAPIVSMAVSRAGDGYWLVASDGGVFAFGARFAGSMGGRPLLRSIVGASAVGNGYVLVDDGGAAFNFSDRPFFGSLPASAFTSTITGITAIG